MAFKPNYNQQRAERNRNKQAKKDAKLSEREEAAARRKAEQNAAPDGALPGTPPASEADPAVRS